MGHRQHRDCSPAYVVCINVRLIYLRFNPKQWCFIAPSPRSHSVAVTQRWICAVHKMNHLSLNLLFPYRDNKQWHFSQVMISVNSYSKFMLKLRYLKSIGNKVKYLPRNGFTRSQVETKFDSAHMFTTDIYGTSVAFTASRRHYKSHSLI